LRINYAEIKRGGSEKGKGKKIFDQEKLNGISPPLAKLGKYTSVFKNYLSTTPGTQISNFIATSKTRTLSLFHPLPTSLPNTFHQWNRRTNSVILVSELENNSLVPLNALNE